MQSLTSNIVIIDNSQYFNLEITHWMPLPSPPSSN
ncbi:DUF551 domain-containing protein [Klebsiella pneumoniae]|nr:DUF551 domain-containing protein [Klebsiella pneumoniae]